MAIKVKKSHFSGTSNVFSKDRDGLAAIIRELAADNAVTRLQMAIAAEDISIATNLTFTDSSTGTAGTVVADIALPAAPIAATGTLGATASAVNTALGKYEDATRVIGTLVNQLREIVTLDEITFASGAVATAGTIPAQDKSVAGTSGATAADFRSAVAACRKAKANLHTLVVGVNETLSAFGLEPIPVSLNGDVLAGLVDIPDAAAAAATGVVALSKADADAFLTALANSIATIAALWNEAMADIADRNLGVAAV